MADEHTQSVLAVHSGALGDVVLFGHLLARLRGRVRLVARGERASLLAEAGVVDSWLDFDALPMHEAFADDPPSGGALRKRLGGCDRLVSCFAEGDRRAERRLVEASGAAEAVFLPTRPPEGFAGHLLELWAERLPAGWATWGEAGPTGAAPWAVPDAWRTEAAATLAKDVCECRGMGVSPMRPTGVSPVAPQQHRGLHGRDGRATCLPAGRRTGQDARATTEAGCHARFSAGVESGRPYVVIHPGAGAEAKCWPVERFLAAAAGLREGGTNVVFVLGPVELDRWRDGRIERLSGEFPVLSGIAIQTLAGLLAGAAAYLGNDSGSSHLAAAVGAPTVALFGPTWPEHFRPIGPHVKVIAAATMADIPAEQVRAEMAEWLSRPAH